MFSLHRPGHLLLYLTIGLATFLSSGWIRLPAVETNSASSHPITTGGHKKRKPVNAVPSEKDVAAYLLVYFKDEDHSLHMALSNDGYSFTDINQGKPVLAGDTLAEQKGIRDPHIMRGNDGFFYMAMTDLHIYAKEAGFRSTQWERDGKEYGWGNNRGIVLMKSKDLVNWSHTVLRVDKAFPEWDKIGCAWAPELIYDPTNGKMMMYFTLRFGNGLSQLYYAYLNSAFTALATEPKLLFQYPKYNKSYIDGDITKVGDKYHLFYVSHDGKAGIKQAVSDKLTTGYVYDEKFYDPEPKACEAPNVWKRIGQKKWVLMYDCYGISPHNFGFSETTDFVHFTNLGHFNEGVMKTTNFTSPKHGVVIHLTRKEAQSLAERYSLTMNF
ncbi:glycoside hydrolase family 43 protein [Spirosoma agri]|uniref:Glycoside hydrolase family 43 protein n=1 Tax=Spirosoma agri TaxID=1987381 RepID=A0A6M0IP87_9BACT|nr:glycoside hydrolase family 43 protein [Spirosoma agri]NEU70086.1 glycoside hydrolase family 43 protein [Spirosoma agri]